MMTAMIISGKAIERENFTDEKCNQSQSKVRSRWKRKREAGSEFQKKKKKRISHFMAQESEDDAKYIPT